MTMWSTLSARSAAPVVNGRTYSAIAGLYQSSTVPSALSAAPMNSAARMRTTPLPGPRPGTVLGVRGGYIGTGSPPSGNPTRPPGPPQASTSPFERSTAENVVPAATPTTPLPGPRPCTGTGTGEP
jgi:hypothetical protein